MIEQDRGPSKKIPSNNFALLDKFDKAVEILSKQKNEDKLDRKGTAKFEEHLDDFFHPQNIFNATRNFPIPASIHASRLEAEKMLNAGDEAKAAKLMLLTQGNTFQHQVLLQYGKKLGKQTMNVGDKSSEKNDDESLEEKQKRLMMFRNFNNPEIMDRLALLPNTWTIVQISSHDLL